MYQRTAAMIALWLCAAAAPAQATAAPVTLLSASAAPAARGANSISFRVRSDSQQPLRISIALSPGLFFNGSRDDNLITIPAGKSEWAIGYSVRYLTPGATLELVGSGADGRDIFRRKFTIGGEGAKPTFDPARFKKASSAHFDLYAMPDTPAAARSASILADREGALSAIEGLVGSPLRKRVPLFFYPDELSKAFDTGTFGAGYANNGSLVEIYSDQEKVDPYHELTHIVADQSNTPPAMFDEGLAVYTTERFAGHAMDDFGVPGLSVDDAVRRNIDRGDYVPLRQLFAFKEIGSIESRSLLSYPQAASFVDWLVKTFGQERFREAYRRLLVDTAPAVNEREFTRIYGMTLDAAEQRWREALNRPLATR